MIARLRGEVLTPDTIMTAGGVGYMVACVDELEPGDTVDLLIHSVWRETSVSLYGFTTTAQLATFEELLKAQGVGASTAMAILSTLGVTGTRRAFADRDIKALCSVAGVGAKSAQKLLAAVSFKTMNEHKVPESDADGGSVLQVIGQALEALGYTKTEIKRTLQRVDPTLDENGALAAAMQYLQAEGET